MFTLLLFGFTAFLSTASAHNVPLLQRTLAAHGVAAVFPTDPQYNNVTQAHNQRFKVLPIAVAFPTSVKQVSAAVVAGAAQKLRVVARSGGHSYIANGLGGRNGALVVDLSKLKQITVRPSNNTALIETGNRLGDVALALNAHGRAMPHGSCSYVGVGGHTGYGGWGYSSRNWGLALDVIRSATVVLANGTIASASATVNPDLFWAIRGASPSFGIVTSIEVQTFPAPPSVTLFEYLWTLPAQSASHALTSFQTFVLTDIPKELGATLLLTAGPTKGSINFAFTGAWYDGDAALLNSTLAPYLEGMPSVEPVLYLPGSFIDSVAMLATPMPLDTSSGPDQQDTFYVKSLMTPDGAPMSNASITAFVSYLANEGFDSDTNWFVLAELYGGKNSAVNAVPLDSTAFAKRDTLFTFRFGASSLSGSPPYPNDGFSFLDGMVGSILDNEPAHWGFGAYLNYLDERLANGAKLYYGSHYDRLKSLKAAFDPHDTFNFPVGIS
ncbi:Glucooligosaccharide oxidase [Favolaschia claudopus]|uniref:Glucooligosaccharide oxidase n=1 Tax=Favolaschia claudopus TaxID=2862362 RepID=A0AAW0CIY9_9AGAR